VMRTRRRVLSIACLAVTTAWLGVALVRAQSGPRFKADPGNTKYEAFDQINAKNAGTLRIAWRHPAVAPEVQRSYPELNVPRNFRSTPLMANGVLYASNGLGFVEAIDPATGRTLWTQQPFEPGLDGLKGVQAARGVAYWPERGHERILSVRGNYLYAVNATTGAAITDFGTGGRIDLRPGLGPDTVTFNWVAPSPIIVKDVVIVGGQGRPS
jgi:glucose dehydrogenase